MQLSAELNAAAETHARDMAVQQRAWHFGSDLTSPRERAFRAGYRGEIVGENLSEGSDSDLTVLATWLDFADTRAVIVDPAARGLGLGWYQEPTGKIWWVAAAGPVAPAPSGEDGDRDAGRHHRPDLLHLGVGDRDAAGGPVLLAPVLGAARPAVDEDVAARPHAERPRAGEVDARSDS